MEFLDQPPRPEHSSPAPDVSICGIDPEVPGRAAIPSVHLLHRGDRPRPDSVEQLLAGRADDVEVRRLTFDVRPFRDVLECRGGWNLLAQLVRDPSDTVTNAVFRAAVAEEPTVGTVLEIGDVDCDVCIVGEGDTVAGRCRHELGRARLSLTTFLADSERLTRRLAEALARPRDRGVRRCLEQALADAVADVPLAVLLGLHRDAPYCTVPGQWSSVTRPGVPA